MKKSIIIYLLLVASSVNAQIITLFGGGGTGNPDGGGPAISVSIADPAGGTFDKNGNYFFASCLSGNQIFEIDTVGKIHLIAGNGTSGFSGDGSMATTAELYVPSTVILDTAGNLYICDAGNNRIRKVDATSGIITTIVGTGTTGGYGGDSGLATAAMLYDPQDICFDKLNNLYIADATNQRIRKVDPSGIITTIAGTGIPGTTGDNGPAITAEIHLPIGLAIDDTGNLYIAGGDHVVRKVNTSGIITTVAGVSGYYTYPGDGIPAISAPIDPIRIGIDPSERLVIADYLNYRVFRINSDGLIYTIAGNGIEGYSGEGGAATAAELNYPSGIAYDTCGNLYFPTTDGHISKILFNPTCAPEKVPQLLQSQITIYPNPFSNTLHIDGIESVTKYGLFNIIGIIEQSGVLQKGSNELPISTLPPGMYLLQLTDEQGRKTMKKVVKE